MCILIYNPISKFLKILVKQFSKTISQLEKKSLYLVIKIISQLLFQVEKTIQTHSIRNQLVVSGFTSLKVYNSLGKEVATLANKKQNAGTYEVDFDGSDLASRIYFYKLESESFSDTKRMILLK